MINVYEYILVHAILQNVLLGGLWYDVAKPTMTFLYPLMLCLNQLYNEGTVVITIDSYMYKFLKLTYIVTLYA